MKKFLILLLCTCFAALSFAYYTTTVDGIQWKYTVSGRNATISIGADYSPAIPSSTSGSITIPSKLGYYPVTSIGRYAFYNCSGLTSVTIPSSVTSIGYSAFSGCTGLTSVTIPEGVTSIGDYAFCDCSGLTSVTIPEGVTSIGDHAFFGCRSLTSVTIPDGVKSIGDYAFCYCESLTSVTIPSSVTEIGNNAFSGCSGLTSVTIPSSVTSIGYLAFYGVKPETLVAAKFPDGNMSKDYLKTLLIPDGVDEIADSAFCNCRRLTLVTIPSSVTAIGENAFSGCSVLSAVNINGGPIEDVAENAFPATNGYYPLEYLTEWDPIIVNGGLWKQLTMKLNGPMPQIKITFDANGGEGSTTLAQEYASTLVVPTVAREGYTMVGWNPVLPAIVPAEDATYVAQWQINSYTQTFDANGGEGGYTVTQDYATNLVAPTVTREGYTFIGWSPTVPTTVPATNATYTAQWRANQYTQTFDANGGEGGASLTQDYATSLIAPTVTREGYTFIGWSPEVPTIVPVANATYTAQWQINQYMITFDAAGGEGGTSVTQDYGSSLAAPTVTREGYTFIGWSPSVPVTVLATNATYTAQWRANQYTQTFDANGGEGGVSLTQDYASSLIAPTVTREGYTFVGWSPNVPATIPSTDATYVAQWRINQYTITFDAAGGEGGTSVTQDYGSSLSAPTVTREGYTFIGWSPNVPATIPSTDAIYVAQWRANQYTMTFDVAGGEGGTSVTQDYGSSLTAPIVTREGYTFIGWSPNVPATIPSTDATYVAQWRINQYTITFDAAGGEGGTSVTQDYGSSLTAPTVIREGYTFAGWLPEVPSITPAVNAIYVAQWAKVYNVTINCKGNGTVSGEGWYQPGASVVLTATPDEGVTFCGWAGFKKTAETTISFVMPKEDVVLSAYFAKSSALDAYLSTHENSGGDADDLDSLVEAEIAKRDLHTVDEMKEMVVDTPVIEAKNGVVTIRLQVKDGAANEVMDGGELSVEITPKAGEKAGFYKFVVPNEQ